MQLRRLAVIGDVHAEDERLELALRTASSLEVDRIACTGDVADGTGSVGRCCALLREYSVACVRGNHDRWLFTGLLRDAKNATQLRDVSAQDAEFLRNLPPTLEMEMKHGSLLLCHGIGESDLEKIGFYDSDYSLESSRVLKAVMQKGYRVMVNGHSHERIVMRVGSLVIVNAGALCHMEDPGFVLLDFPANRIQWHTLADSRFEVADEVPLFVMPLATAVHQNRDV